MNPLTYLRNLFTQNRKDIQSDALTCVNIVQAIKYAVNSGLETHYFLDVMPMDATIERRHKLQEALTKTMTEEGLFADKDFPTLSDAVMTIRNTPEEDRATLYTNIAAGIFWELHPNLDWETCIAMTTGIYKTQV